MHKQTVLSGIVNETKELNTYVLAALLFIALSYSVFWVFDEDIITRLGKEDGLFENFTALFFLIASIVFFLTFLSNKNPLFLIFFFVFFFGAGEEISWGQRIFNFNTPDIMDKINAKHEINLHNIQPFDKGSWLNKLTSMNFLYNIFWLVYCILLPVIAFLFQPISSIIKKIRLPVPPISIGIFFIINWLIYKLTDSFFLTPDMPRQKDISYVRTVYEIEECVSAYLFMILSIYFFKIKSYRSHFNSVDT